MGYATDLGEVRNGKFFAWGLDDPNHVDRANVFGFMPHAALAGDRHVPVRVTCEKCGIPMDRRADKSLLTYERIPEDE
jgi:hypothetical protein